MRENWLDAHTRMEENESDMKTFSTRRTVSLAAASLFSLSFLASCGDEGPKTDQTEQKPEPAATESTPATPSAGTLAESRDALFNAAVYDLLLTISDNDTFPVFNSKTRDFVELLSNYCDHLRAESKDARERVRAVSALAKVLRNVGGAYPRAEAAYRDALKECEALSQEELNSAEGQRTLSSINNGIASCLLMQGKNKEALEYYNAALKIDEAQFKGVDMKEGDSISGKEAITALSRAVVEVVDSYRCLADCQLIGDDPEEALDTYKKGIEIAAKYQAQPTVEMAVSFSKIYTSYGNLEQRNGNTEKARQAWALAANLCTAANKGTSDLLQKLETKRNYDSLIEALKATQPAEKPAEEAPAAN